MTLTIIDECTHNKTFSVYGKPNGALNILEDAGYNLNPRVHDQTDGSRGPSSALTSELLPPKENVIGVKGPSEFISEDD